MTLEIDLDWHHQLEYLEYIQHMNAQWTIAPERNWWEPIANGLSKLTETTKGPGLFLAELPFCTLSVCQWELFNEFLTNAVWSRPLHNWDQITMHIRLVQILTEKITGWIWDAGPMAVLLWLQSIYYHYTVSLGDCTYNATLSTGSWCFRLIPLACDSVTVGKYRPRWVRYNYTLQQRGVAA